MAKLSTQEFIDAIKELSVIELNDLVKALEEEFGVSAAAGMVVAAAGPAAVEEEKTEFDVERSWLTPLRRWLRPVSPRRRLRLLRSPLRKSAQRSPLSNDRLTHPKTQRNPGFHVRMNTRIFLCLFLLPEKVR